MVPITLDPPPYHQQSNSAPASSTIPCSPKAAAPTSEQKVAAEDDISTAAVLKILISQKAGSTQGRMCSSEQLAPPTVRNTLDRKLLIYVIAQIAASILFPFFFLTRASTLV